jgi:hypothetical protein
VDRICEPDNPGKDARIPNIIKEDDRITDHNRSAMFTDRSPKAIQNHPAKDMEGPSSGPRINRTGDDACANENGKGIGGRGFGFYRQCSI